MEKEKTNPVKIVQTQLWSSGFSAKDVSRFTGYSLLVGDNTKVEVQETKFNKKSNKWVFKANLSADVLAIIVQGSIEEDLILYMKITPENIKRIGAENIKLSSEEIKEIFTKSISETFKKNK